MKNTIKNLWHGNIAPETYNPFIIPHYKELSHQYCEYDEILKPLLSEKAKKLLEEQHEISLRMNSLTDSHIFVQGFTLGARFIMEILNDDGEKNA